MRCRWRSSISRACTPLLVLVGIVISVLAVTAGASGASDNGSWSVDPGGRSGPGARNFFNYTLKPEQAFQDTVTVANLSDAPLTLDLYPTDAYNTSLDAGFALLAADEEPTDAGSWIQLATQQITLKAGTQAEVPFQITIPRGAEPGDHAAGIVAQNTETESEINAEGVGIEVRRRVAARVYVRVDGPLQPQLQVTQVEVEHHSAIFPPLTGGGEAVIAYEIRNTGNTRLAPTAELVVKGFLGRTIIRFEPRELNELLPGSSLIITERFENLPPLDRLTAQVSITGSDAQGGDPVVAKGSRGFWVVSWAVFAALLLVGPLFMGWRRVRRRPEGQPGDDGSPGSRRELVEV